MSLCPLLCLPHCPSCCRAAVSRGRAWQPRPATKHSMALTSGWEGGTFFCPVQWMPQPGWKASLLTPLLCLAEPPGSRGHSHTLPVCQSQADAAWQSRASRQHIQQGDSCPPVRQPSRGCMNVSPRLSPEGQLCHLLYEHHGAWGHPGAVLQWGPCAGAVCENQLLSSLLLFPAYGPAWLAGVAGPWGQCTSLWGQMLTVCK